jgi:crossover junction endodeoxyribonuclease RuvC
MIVLGIDQSLTSTGWSLKEDGVLKEHGILTSDKTQTNFERAIVVADQIFNLDKKFKPDKSVIEGIPFMSRSNVTRDLAGLQFLIVDRLLRDGWETLDIVPPTKLKKFATGSGKASKDEMVEALPEGVKEKFEKIPKTKGRYDLADSYWLATFGEDDE